MIQINCNPCIKGKHDNCSNENCLCKNDNHGKIITTIIDEFTKVAKDTIPTVDELKKSLQDNPIRLAPDDKNRIDVMAERLIDKYNFITLTNSDEILVFNGKIYHNKQAEKIIKEETEKIIAQCEDHDRREVISKIKARTYADLEDFDNNPNEITILNGILRLDTLELRPHTPTNLSRVLLPVEFHKPEFEINDETMSEDIEKNLKDTLFYKSLKSSFTIDEKFHENDFITVLEMIASVFVTRHIDSKAFMNLGNGENGKSVILGYIESLLGKDNVSHIPLQDIASDKFASAELDRKLANIFTDLERNELRDSGKIKAITDGEGLQVQRKHGHPFTLYPFVKLMFSCNKFPKVYDQTQGFFRRWIIIKWLRNFESDSERIEYLREKLSENQEEKNLVFSCLVKIANKLNKSGKFSHSKNWKDVQKVWNENADPIDDFDTHYIIDSESNKSKRETYQFYKDIMISKQEVPLGMGQFSKAFAEYHEEDFDRVDGIRTRAWLNIDFKRPVQTKMKDHDE